MGWIRSSGVDPNVQGTRIFHIRLQLSLGSPSQEGRTASVFPFLCAIQSCSVRLIPSNKHLQKGKRTEGDSWEIFTARKLARGWGASLALVLLPPCPRNQRPRFFVALAPPTVLGHVPPVPNYCYSGVK